MLALRVTPCTLCDMVPREQNHEVAFDEACDDRMTFKRNASSYRLTSTRTEFVGAHLHRVAKIVIIVAFVSLACVLRACCVFLSRGELCGHGVEKAMGAYNRWRPTVDASQTRTH